MTAIARTSGSDRFTYVGPALPFTVAEGASQAITIRFAPQTAGDLSATFAITSDDHLATSLPFTVTGTGTITPVYQLDVSSTPDNGASISVSPADRNGASNGATPFSRSYTPITVALTAPSAFNGKVFKHWLLDGAVRTGTSLQVAMTAGHTAQAVFALPIRRSRPSPPRPAASARPSPSWAATSEPPSAA